MNICSIFRPSRSTILNKIAKKNAQNIENYIRILPELPQEVDQFARENAQTIARIGKKNGCRIEFAKGEGLFAQTPQLNIYQKILHIHGNKDLPFTFFSDAKKMEVALPDLNDTKSAITYIKKMAHKVFQDNRNTIRDHRIPSNDIDFFRT